MIIKFNFIGLIGIVLNRKSILIIIMSIELLVRTEKSINFVDKQNINRLTLIDSNCIKTEKQ